MGQDASVCEHCGAALQAQSRFCRSCGKPVSGGGARVSHNRTMVGVPLPDLSAAMPRNSAAGADGSPAAASVPPPGDAHELDPSERVTIDPQEPPRDRPPLNRTILGVATPELPGSVMPTSKVPRGAVTADRISPPLSETRPTSTGDEGLHGASAPGVGGSGYPGRSSRDNGHSTATPDDDSGYHRPAPRRGSSPSSSGRPRYVDPGRRRQRWAPSIAALVLATFALLAAGALGYVAVRGRGPEVRVVIESRPEGESLLFQVPGAPKGARLRFGGQEQTLDAGRTRFALGADSLRVGKNAVLFDVVYPDGKVEDGRVTIQVDYRVTLDTAPLRAGRPAVDVVVAAVLGSKVWLDGEQVTLDMHGRALRRDAIDPDANPSGQIEHVVRYRVEPPSGELSVGELRAVIPMTTMQIDRPGALITTDQARVEISGAVDKDARLTIDGKPVNVAAGRFLYHYDLPAQGEYQPRLVAMAPGKAPRVAVLTLRRVNDLVQAANGYNPDPNLTYVRIAQSPATYRGQRVAFEGRVYNVRVENGKSALQMLVRECPQGERCPLWINYGAATEFTKDSWVRVLGTVDGEQQFRADNEEIKSVPKVEAAFLLRAQP